MAGLPRPAAAAPAPRRTNSSMRPPARPTRAVRSQSPAESLMASRTRRSPSAQPNGTAKRKVRESEGEDTGEQTNIHVVVRCRGRNDREVKENSGVVVSTKGIKGDTVDLSMGTSTLGNKTYHFDKVFSPAADQAIIYDDVVTPILDEMLSGFNCTIFAYGQTGTGKTYTMSGDMTDTLGLLSDNAGIIPRVLYALFNKLEAEEVENDVKCSFIELYNEELRDLLAVDDGKNLKIFEDSKKGHPTTVVQGMEETHIKSANSGIKLLQAGSHRRQVAATKCNDLSSRSHTVFTITAYIKRTSETGEDYISAGKLNLVDLAGSENIGRSGAENKRAAEAGLINKSLLTLGRVINALVDKSPRIPYRDSKLTRLLQDSLGGRTKTCIIATISPAKSNLEETISTLDYAFRAKNIRNKPQLNSLVSKKTMLREYTAEIEKLKTELIATRQRNGVYLSSEAYEEMTTESESRKILSEEQKAKIEAMEASLRNKVQELFSLTSNFNNLKKDNETTKATLDKTQDVLQQTEFVLKTTAQNLAEETLLREAHQKTEEQLHGVGRNLITTLEQSVSDVSGLHAKLRRRSDLHAVNKEMWESTSSGAAAITSLVESRVEEFQVQQSQSLAALSNRLDRFVASEVEKLQANQAFLEDKIRSFEKCEGEVHEQTSRSHDDMNEVLEEIKVLREEVKLKVGEGLKGLSAAAANISGGVINELEGFQTQLYTSYSGLGRDFRTAFERVTSQMSAQKQEIENLKHQLQEARQQAVAVENAASTRMDQVMEDDRQKAEEEKANLLSQITALIQASTSTRTDRLRSNVSTVQQNLAESRAAALEADASFNDEIGKWAEKEAAIIAETSQKKEALKEKMKSDWEAVNEHHAAIKLTTKAVHEETVRIVDEQMKDMEVQMQALDEFVTRARSQNGLHHETHKKSLDSLSTVVHQSYDNIADHFASTSAEVREFSNEVSEHSIALREAIPPLDEDVRKPLAELGDTLQQAAIKDYSITGQTPQKIDYNFTRNLPRTDAHNDLLAKLRKTTGQATPARLEALNEDVPTNEVTSPVSPSKTAVFTDAMLALQEKENYPLPPDQNQELRDQATQAQTNTSGLRELDVNLAHLHHSAATTTLLGNNLGFKASGAKHLSAEISDPEITTAVTTADEDEKPQLKRVATNDANTKLPLKRARQTRAAGAENDPALVASGRRLRSSPNA